MNHEQKLCYINSLHRILNIPIAYRCSNAGYYFQSFSLASEENSWDFIMGRLKGVLSEFPNAHALYFIHKTLIMSGIVINKKTDEFIFIGPVASTLTTEKDITDYLLLSDLSEKTTLLITNYMKKNCSFSITQLKELLININLVINEEILAEEMLTSIYDREKEEKVLLANKHFENEEEQTEKINQKEADDFTSRLNNCITEGDTETLKDMFLQMDSIPYNRHYCHSVSENRNNAIGSLFIAHHTAWKAGINTDELERIRQYYLTKISTAQQTKEIHMATLQALIEFANSVKKNKQYITKNPVVDKTIKYIQANITTKLQIDDIADTLHISKTYLFRKFKEETGKTLTQYINEEKIHKAIFYLLFTDKSLAEIACHLSFSSQSYFQTVFKNITGQSPAVYRKKPKQL